MGLKESSTAFNQEMSQKQFDWTKSAQERELSLKEKANAFDEMMRSDQFAWTKGIQEREMTLKEKAEAYDQMAAEREYERRYGNTGVYAGGYADGSYGGTTRTPASVGNSEPVRYTPSQSDLEAVKKNANTALINSVFGNASTPAGMTLKPPVVTNAYKPPAPNPIRYTDGYQTSGSKVPTLVQRFGQLER